MVSNQLLKEIVSSVVKNDREAINQTILKIIASEQKAKHFKIANELTQILDNFQTQERDFEAWKEEVNFIPTDRDRNLSLFEVISSKKLLNDIVLNQELLGNIEKLLDEWKNKSRLASYRLFPIKNVLFYGPSGCGKTLCAYVLAGELQLPLILIHTETIISSLLGETAINLKKIFDSIGDEKSAVVFFDEFDSIAKSRIDYQEHGEVRRAVSLLLHVIEVASPNLLIICATNHPKLLDLATWRRFDLVLEFPKPNDAEILETLQLKMRNFPYEPISISDIREFDDFTHADIERACFEAIKEAIINNKKRVTKERLLHYCKEEFKRRVRIEELLK